MDANAWIALAGLAFVVVVQIAVSAFILGGLFQRVRALEKAAPDLTTLISSVAKLEAAVDTLTKRFDDSLGWLTKIESYRPGPPPNGRRRGQ